MNRFYEVQTHTLCDGWVNCWTDENEKPIRYGTKEKAQSELEDHIADMREAVKAGHMEDFNDDDYRVMEVTP